MMFSQTAFGVGVFAVVGAAVFNLVGDLTAPPPPEEPKIIVHSLKYSVVNGEPTVTQHRTVTAENAILARWEAKVLQSGEIVCEGSGVWEYASGEQTATLEFDRWVGEEGCFAKLKPGVKYQLAAEYKWGDGKKASQTSLGFTKGQTNG